MDAPPLLSTPKKSQVQPSSSALRVDNRSVGAGQDRAKKSRDLHEQGQRFRSVSDPCPNPLPTMPSTQIFARGTRHGASPLISSSLKLPQKISSRRQLLALPFFQVIQPSIASLPLFLSSLPPGPIKEKVHPNPPSPLPRTKLNSLYQPWPTPSTIWLLDALVLSGCPN